MSTPPGGGNVGEERFMAVLSATTSYTPDGLAALTMPPTEVPVPVPMPMALPMNMLHDSGRLVGIVDLLTDVDGEARV